MLETVREFAGELLDDAGERDAVSRPPRRPPHGAASRVAAVHVARGCGQLARRERLGAQRGVADSALTLALAGRAWRAEWPELILRLERALAARPDAGEAARGRALSQLSIAYTVTGDRPAALNAGEEAVALLRRHGSSFDVAEGLLSLGQALHDDPVRARAAYEEALTRRHGGRPTTPASVAALHMLGELERDYGTRSRARELLQQAIEKVAVRGHDPISETHGLADLELEDGDLDAAEEAYARVAEQSLGSTPGSRSPMRWAASPQSRPHAGASNVPADCGAPASRSRRSTA